MPTYPNASAAPTMVQFPPAAPLLDDDDAIGKDDISRRTDGDIDDAADRLTMAPPAPARIMTPPLDESCRSAMPAVAPTAV